ncbi:Uncharacterised protein [Mycobacteroides abscessus subsp. abscessus]|uniref:Secreted protein n=1 Tax=Mycobacteroides abscessus TaxID=36809 RepID=A0AB33T8C3_9MYCO|nr:hypothetical protein [Mycobacteroides abscessus]EIC62447.1 hypothetical protein S7W_23776 [Mycobacteroides abscessus M94]MBE5494461.1 hypothetical protein [Mycobacteroides abscessus]MDM2170938.1 hypothetical protein [Mycobacteroides abscessus]MDM2176070.1 hypothetical protein [Mycobacteroides abscessus]MDM2207032.1 hypothetical protein [Mycobacteroides abscessus]
MTTSVRNGARGFATLGLIVALCVSPSPKRAGADPAGFPDLDRFVAVAADDYFVTYIRGRRLVAFSTPYSLMCDFDAPVDLTAPPTPRLHCAGDLPGMTDGHFASHHSPPACTAGTADIAPSGGYEFMPYDWKCGDINFRLDDFPYWSGQLLDRGEKLSYGNITCAVGDDNLVACLDRSGGDHGFVIRPSGSRAF